MDILVSEIALFYKVQYLTDGVNLRPVVHQTDVGHVGYDSPDFIIYAFKLLFAGLILIFV